ncbi:MAG: ABC transporter ATP-binding protein [Actinomycetota bacterium]|nr:ABC transporter ATP-binding protein [Actinomycetota bacterium]
MSPATSPMDATAVLAAPAPSDAHLDVRGVTVRFGGIVANDDVNLSVPYGAIAGLIGPNGAGKTTLFNVITGAQAPTAGRVVLAGEDITDLSRQARARRGMARTFQNLSLVPTLSVLDNVTLGFGRFRSAGLLSALVRSPALRRQDRRIREMAAVALEFVGLGSALDVTTSELSYGDRRRLEIARALACDPDLLLLDEPSAGMSPVETAALAEVIAQAHQRFGLTVFLVEHDMSFVRALAAECTVIEFGRVIASGETSDVLADPRVAEAYLGTGATG